MHSFKDIEARPVKAAELQAGDVIVSPALRAETVIDVTPLGDFRTTVTTEVGRKTFEWTLDRWTAMPTLRCSKRRSDPRIGVWESAYSGGTVIKGGICHNPHNDFHQFELVTAGFDGRGKGWTLYDGPADPVSGLTKAQARSAVRKSARAHARRLGLPFKEVSE